MKKILLSLLTLLSFGFAQDCWKVYYWVDSSKPGISITYENSQGNTEQVKTSKNGWSYSFTSCSGDFVYISAQTHNENAEIKVRILYRFKEIESAKSYGDYVIATASGLIP